MAIACISMTFAILLTIHQTTKKNRVLKYDQEAFAKDHVVAKKGSSISNLAQGNRNDSKKTITPKTVEETGGKNKNIAVVTLADDYYMPCASRLVKDLRGRGSWKGDLYVMTIGDIREEDLKNLKSLNVTVVRTKGVLDKWVPKHQHLKKFRKMELLYETIFRKYDELAYLDADGTIGGPIYGLLNVTFPKGETMLFRDNGEAIGKGSLYKNEFRGGLSKLLGTELYENFKQRFPDRGSPGATAFFIVDVRQLKSIEETKRESIYLMEKYSKIFKYHDQSLMLIQFYHESAVFAWCAAHEIKLIDSVPLRQSYCYRLREKVGQNKDFSGWMYEHGYKGCRRSKP